VSLSFDEFDVRYVQYQSLRAPALRAEEALQLQAASERPRGDQPRLRLERHCRELGAYLAPAARLVLIGLVSDLEVDRREAARRMAQRPELKQPAAQL
jgi:hypothetical protein